MEKQVIFKSALNGFEKSSVLKYIDELNSKLNKTEADCQAQLEEMENERYSLIDQVAALELGAKEAQKKYDTEMTAQQEQLNEKQALIEKLEAEVKKLSLQVEEQEQELIMQREQNRLIREQAESVEMKSKKYDEAAASIGDVILGARQDAARILEEARIKADAIVSVAKQEAADIQNDAQNKLNATQNRMDQLKAQFFSIREQMNSSVALLNDQFGQVEASMAPVVEETAEEPAVESAAENAPKEAPAEENKAEHPLKAILEQAANSQKKNFFRS